MKKKLFLCSALALCIFGINTTVKAESYIVDSAPEKFTTNAMGRNYQDGKLINTENDAVLVNTSIYDKTKDSKGQNVIDYHTKDKKKVFCLERLTQYTHSAEYTITTQTVDYPIVYIIANSESYYKAIGTDGVSADIQKLEQSWLTQVAVWRYENNENFNARTINVDGIWEEGTQVNTNGISDYYYYSKRAKDLWDAAGKLVTAAKQATDPASVTNLAFSYDGKNELNKDEKTVKTSIISLQTNGVSSYSMNLANAIPGTKVYAESGEEITDLNNVTAKRFYLVMPIDNVDNYTYDFNITAKATGYEYYKGYKYTSGTNQPLVLVTKESKDLDATINIKGSHLEDTALSVADSIYFVGFLILLAGVGLVYFNAKQKQEQI